MMGLEGPPKASPNNKITPLERYGVKTISIQFSYPEASRSCGAAPSSVGAIQQFLRDVEWGDLDYLVIDLPPGTSDAQLTPRRPCRLGFRPGHHAQEVSLSDVGRRSRCSSV